MISHAFSMFLSYLIWYDDYFIKYPLIINYGSMIYANIKPNKRILNVKKKKTFISLTYLSKIHKSAFPE